MWRVDKVIAVSHDVHPLNEPNRVIGVPPPWYDPTWEFLVDEIGDFLIDEADDFYLISD